MYFSDQKVVASKSWSGDIKDWDCFGADLFFLTDDKKIYKATFLEPSSIQVKFVREVEEDETHLGHMLVSRPKDSGQFAYRLCDDPKGGIRINMEYATVFDGQEDDDLEDLRLEAIYRKKLIYVRESGGVTWARELTQSIIAIDVEEGPNAYDGRLSSVYAPEEASLIYLLTDMCELTVLHPITMEERSFGLRLLPELLRATGDVQLCRRASGKGDAEGKMRQADKDLHRAFYGHDDELKQFERDAADFAEEIKTDEDE
ncbi:hypothetical protein PRIPAC_81508 [Pristionchus pacificus]|uniref:Uncharacterized protein n=1 Tax=Pristionchus pacificus TaxID=54126 RepID=A0A2A6BHH6_PRIPA|nr:hypothetical protein PRIPAC_78138 [Pristionchus pacificus]KAF8375079.1 hypothetical protein PRIPAC_81508 [Pristionchus pacificus]|eukprot:PDM65241.1 hypothetical protein PRIPAC_52183 [Pristionchus pacificus]